MSIYRKKSLTSFGRLGSYPMATFHFYRALVVHIFFTLVILPMVFAVSSYAHSDIDPEIAEINEELANQPNNADLLMRRGQLYRFNGKFAESIIDLDRAFQLDSKNERIVLERSRTLVLLGRESEAQVGFEQCLEGKSGISRMVPLVERAHLYARIGQPDLAITDFSEALKLYPTVELYLVRGHLQESLGRLEVAANGYRDGLSRLTQASILRKELIRIEMVQGHYTNALILIEEELTAASVKTEWYLHRAEALVAMGQTEASVTARTHALAEANRAFAKRPTPLHRVARAKVYQALGQFESAKEDLRLAVQAAPRLVEARDLLKKMENQ